MRYASGARVPVLVHTAPIYDNNGEVALVLEVFAGTQELDKLARQIMSTQQRYAQLFDAVPLQIAVLDRRFNITANNAKFKEAFGDQIGGKFFQIFRPAVFPAHRDPISMTVRDGHAHQGKMIMAGPDRRQYTMLAQTSPIMTVNGKMIQVMVIFKDITEIRQLKDNLASLGLMLGAVCHDMKGCLTGLDAGIYMIDKGFYRNTPGRIEEGLELIRLMKDRIHKLIFSVLYSAKERSLELESVDLHGFVGDLVVAVNNRIRGADIEFNYTVAEDAGYMEIDAGLMRSALINILDNAVDACLEDSRKSQHRIDFQVHALAGDVVFEIGDTGKGIPKEELRNIFNVFYSSKKQKGTGLGLYITGNVIKKHGGTIDIDSVFGEGTTFYIRLPRYQGVQSDR